MQNSNIKNKLIDIKRQITELGVEYLGTQEPIPLSDVGMTLKPFIKIDTAINLALKKISSNVIPGAIPKSNTLKS
ncbi:hypothetical protein IUY40_02845 [Flavobacterium sp. ALJ2]|uniref:hypothetical protein n=1 Tax=Flavobacterium sp. ALJ2 TaxID=2786960 RepID=UPI00189C8A64|nr:hypothetical protein [Flavobacterium sp. ALJ2]MBF7090483.1 hypothetical protein [Flavobacterium sp. ALJ2]